jgi:cell division protein FtsW
VSYRALRRISTPLLVTGFVLLVAVLVLGTSVNGARRWFDLGPISVQPSELMKLALALWLAALLARKAAPATFGQLLKPIGIVTGLAALLVLLQPDLGTALSFAIIAGTVLLLSGVRLRLLAGSGAILIGAVLLLSWLEPYRKARLLAFLDPWADPQAAGYQSVQALLAVGSGGIFGVGLGEGVQKIHYLPEASTDMIFAIIGEELGLLGTATVILAFCVFGYAGFRIALACRDPFGKRLAAALTALICGQAAINIAAVLGIAPMTGVPLPFVSYGGSSLIVSLCAVGILLNIAVSDAGEASDPVPDRRGRDGRARPAGAGGRRSASGARRERELRRVGAR